MGQSFVQVDMSSLMRLPPTSLDEARQAFDAQAIRLHPNRVKHSLRPAAESKMARVNAAGTWSVATWNRAVDP